MTKHVLVIGGRTSDEGETDIMAGYAAYFVDGLTDVNTAFVHFDELSFAIAPKAFSIYDHRNRRELCEYSLVIFRGKIRANSELAHCVSRYCVLRNVPFFNDYTPYRPASKLSQAVTFFELGVKFTKTIYAMQPAIIEQVATRELATPFILKDSYGSHGNDNYLVHNSTQFMEILSTSADKRFIAQEYFPNDCDYRLLCIGSESFIIRRRASDDSHLNNTSQGGTAEIVEPSYLPAECRNEAHAIAEHLKMGIAGVDLLYNEQTGEYVFLEVNSQPQLNSGAFPEQKQQVVRRYIASLLSGSARNS